MTNAPEQPAGKQAKTWDKARRLTELPKRLEARPRTVADLASDFNVGVRSIQRDLVALEAMGYHLEKSADTIPQYFIPKRGHFLRAPEALAAFIALRLAYHQSPQAGSHMRRALEDLTTMLPIQLRKTLAASLQDTGAGQLGERAMEKVSQAWLGLQVLQFDYLRPNGKVQCSNELCVYFIEINRTNLAPYVIGLERKHRRAIRTFKLSRMRQLELLPDTYVIDPEFDPRDFLSGAWGIIGQSDGGGAVTVQVRFAPEVAYRVLEGGYPNATFAPQADGSVLAEFYAGVNSDGLPLELIPFLLGWGPRAEVLSPPNVREHWLAELRAAVRRYG